MECVRFVWVEGPCYSSFGTEKGIVCGGAHQALEAGCCSRVCPFCQKTSGEKGEGSRFFSRVPSPAQSSHPFCEWTVFALRIRLGSGPVASE